MVRYSGVLGVEEPHQSIPNLVVKLYCGDDTVGEPLGRIDDCIKDALAIANTSTSENSELNRTGYDEIECNRDKQKTGGTGYLLLTVKANPTLSFRIQEFGMNQTSPSRIRTYD
ncbi:hypothetical protein S245_009678, partial [Arachis hypogaea]